ncbi:hypothetical protein NONI108955_36780 [Nocardia ninae]|uniref:Uncharacterized protein n=1 Tax=Nocardia ninae NBRC 108245 TaxID=1210091 RepID=A0A511MDE6_9NOCA|nr:hypothetical protein [Nocardia ninae]GEM38652.1 hypothetical protein NN4_31710 [Nocardia ninae NBRC 108245]
MTLPGTGPDSSDECPDSESDQPVQYDVEVHVVAADRELIEKTIPDAVTVVAELRRHDADPFTQERLAALAALEVLNSDLSWFRDEDTRALASWALEWRDHLANRMLEWSIRFVRADPEPNLSAPRDADTSSLTADTDLDLPWRGLINFSTQLQQWNVGRIGWQKKLTDLFLCELFATARLDQSSSERDAAMLEYLAGEGFEQFKAEVEAVFRDLLAEPDGMTA